MCGTIVGGFGMFALFYMLHTQTQTPTPTPKKSSSVVNIYLNGYSCQCLTSKDTRNDKDKTTVRQNVSSSQYDHDPLDGSLDMVDDIADTPTKYSYL